MRPRGSFTSSAAKPCRAEDAACGNPSTRRVGDEVWLDETDPGDEAEVIPEALPHPWSSALGRSALGHRSASPQARCRTSGPVVNRRAPTIRRPEL